MASVAARRNGIHSHREWYGIPRGHKFHNRPLLRQGAFFVVVARAHFGVGRYTFSVRVPFRLDLRNFCSARAFVAGRA